jgi:hypothetical protein
MDSESNVISFQHREILPPEDELQAVANGTAAVGRIVATLESGVFVVIGTFLILSGFIILSGNTEAAQVAGIFTMLSGGAFVAFAWFFYHVAHQYGPIALIIGIVFILGIIARVL